MKKFVRITLLVAVLLAIIYFLLVYFVPYSTGYRSGELVKITNKGILFKTWEGTLSQGVSDEQQFHFSVEHKDGEVLDKLKDYQGSRVRVTYIERFGTFPWMGDTNYYVKEVEKVDQ